MLVCSTCIIINFFSHLLLPLPLLPFLLQVEALSVALREEGVYVGVGSVSSVVSKQKRQAATSEGAHPCTQY